MSSLWIKSAYFPSFEKLKNDLTCDIVIIGGGLVGLLSAYQLVKSGKKIILIESNKLMQSTSGKSTGKITSQHGYLYYDLVKQKGIEFARDYFLANQEAIKEYERIIEELKIDCDYKTVNSYLYAINEEESSLLDNEFEAYQKCQIPGKLTEKTTLPITAKKALVISDQAHFNPVKFALGIINYLVDNNISIYEDTKAIDVKETDDYCSVETENNVITAKQVIIATHYPIINKKNLLFAKMYADKDYIVATKVDKEVVDGNYINIINPTMSFRMNNDYLLVAGLDHRTGTTNDTRGYFSFLKTVSKDITNKDSDYEWSTEDCMSVDKVPYIGYLSKKETNVFIATGFNKWGITHSMVASNIIKDYILNKSNKYCYLYNPSRFSITSDLFNHAIHSVVNLTAGLFSEKRCTHMGCKLNYNKAEKTWDCPCHGSSFDESGKVLYSPATKELKK